MENDPVADARGSVRAWLSCRAQCLWIDRNQGNGCVATVEGPRALQASPSAGDLTPYTVQVAVYDGRGMAAQAQRLLQELGYDAFIVQMSRAGGSSRYRIYVGRFVTKEEAASESQRLAADTRFRDFKDAFVLVR